MYIINMYQLHSQLHMYNGSSKYFSYNSNTINIFCAIETFQLNEVTLERSIIIKYAQYPVKCYFVNVLA